jgi:regulator of protease activity HflC (stomatin/prohibitin superfamily)
VKLQYNVGNFILAVTKLAQTNLRNVVGDLDLDAALTSREVINAKLRQILDDATDKWGVRVVRVEIQRIEPPVDVTDAMHRQMKAERDRRAAVTEAEGLKRAAILKAEGVKESQVLEADGQAEAIKRVADAEKYQKLTVAEGEGQAIERVFGAIHNGDPTPDLIAIRYLEALQGIADGQATKIFLPLDTQGVLGSVGVVQRQQAGLHDGHVRVPAQGFGQLVRRAHHGPDGLPAVQQLLHQQAPGRAAGADHQHRHV